MTNRRTTGALLAILVGGVCASDRQAVVVAAPTPVAAPVVGVSDKVIVRLVGRRQTVTVLAGHGQSLYSVADSSGRTVVSRVTLEELRVSHPEAYKMVEPGATAYAGLE
jgi:hypothetical protein